MKDFDKQYKSPDNVLPKCIFMLSSMPDMCLLLNSTSHYSSVSPLGTIHILRQQKDLVVGWVGLEKRQFYWFSVLCLCWNSGWLGPKKSRIMLTLYMDGPLASSICTSTAFQVTQMWCTLTDKAGNALLISFFLNCFQDKEGTLENCVLANFRTHWGLQKYGKSKFGLRNVKH